VKPGMNVNAKIVVARAEDVVLVPLEAVSYDDEDKASVTVVAEDGQETVTKVTVGLTNTTSAQIVKGVSAGQVVVLTQTDQQSAEEE